jgi:hypothetical protein
MTFNAVFEPRTVSSAADLRGMQRNGHYILTNDIDMSSELWSPLFPFDRFTGTLDGRGFEIRNLTFNMLQGSRENIGRYALFYENAGTVRNLSISFSVNNIINDDAVFGGIAYMNSGLIENCRARGTVRLTVTSGGLLNIGLFAATNTADGTIRNSEASEVTIHGVADILFTGVIAAMNHGFIVNCSVIATVINLSDVASGFTAVNYGEIRNSLTAAKFADTSVASGFGFNFDNGKIRNSLSLYSPLAFDSTGGNIVDSYEPFYEIDTEADTADYVLRLVGGGDIREMSVLNDREFYTGVLGWPENIWSFDNLDYEKGNLPRIR